MELCTAIEKDGLTPSKSLTKYAQKYKFAVAVMIRNINSFTLNAKQLASY